MYIYTHTNTDFLLQLYGCSIAPRWPDSRFEPRSDRRPPPSPGGFFWGGVEAELQPPPVHLFMLQSSEHLRAVGVGMEVEGWGFKGRKIEFGWLGIIIFFTIRKLDDDEDDEAHNDAL